MSHTLTAALLAVASALLLSLLQPGGGGFGWQ